MGWAMGVASVDTYVHWVVRRVDLGEGLPTALHKLPVEFGDLVSLANDMVEARRIGQAVRPQVRARNVMNDVLLTKTFQSADAVKTGLEMAGVHDVWTKLAAAITPPESKAAIIGRLGTLAHRRNRIVHEGDLKRQIRPRSIARDDLSAADVRAELDWIRRFVAALAVVAP